MSTAEKLVRVRESDAGRSASDHDTERLLHGEAASSSADGAKRALLWGGVHSVETVKERGFRRQHAESMPCVCSGNLAGCVTGEQGKKAIIAVFVDLRMAGSKRDPGGRGRGEGRTPAELGSATRCGGEERGRGEGRGGRDRREEENRAEHGGRSTSAQTSEVRQIEDERVAVSWANGSNSNRLPQEIADSGITRQSFFAQISGGLVKSAAVPPPGTLRLC